MSLPDCCINQRPVIPRSSRSLPPARPGEQTPRKPVIPAKAGIQVSREDAGVLPAQGTKLGRGANFRCLMSDAPIPGDYIKAEGKVGRMGSRLIAIVAEGDRGRVYLPPTAEQEAAARKAAPEWKPDIEFFQQAFGFRVGDYGMTKWSDLFTPRQLVALKTFSDLVAEAMAHIKRDALGARTSRRKRSIRRIVTESGKIGKLAKSWEQREFKAWPRPVPKQPKVGAENAVQRRGSRRRGEKERPTSMDERNPHQAGQHPWNRHDSTSGPPGHP